MTTMKKIVVSVLLFFLFTLLALPLCGKESPLNDGAVEVIETLNGVLVDCMKRGDELGYSGRYALLEPVMKQAFFFSYMVRKSTGAFWKNLDSGQQKKLIERYITWSVGRYAQRFNSYKGQQFLVVSSEPFLKKYIKVIVEIIKQDGSKRQLNYLLANNKGAWVIVDIQVKGVSQLSLTRAQFKSVLKNQGIDGLLELLDTKIHNLQQGA
jgi:phospholipid transport system substrate-binding protein